MICCVRENCCSRAKIMLRIQSQRSNRIQSARRVPRHATTYFFLSFSCRSMSFVRATKHASISLYSFLHCFGIVVFAVIEDKPGVYCCKQASNRRAYMIDQHICHDTRSNDYLFNAWGRCNAKSHALLRCRTRIVGTQNLILMIDSTPKVTDDRRFTDRCLLAKLLRHPVKSNMIRCRPRTLSTYLANSSSFLFGCLGGGPLLPLLSKIFFLKKERNEINTQSPRSRSHLSNDRSWRALRVEGMQPT